jgi:hypothetical protein
MGFLSKSTGLMLVSVGVVAAVSCGSDDKARSVPADAGAGGEPAVVAGHDGGGNANMQSQAGAPAPSDAGMSNGGTSAMALGGAPAVSGGAAGAEALEPSAAGAGGFGGAVDTGPVMCSDYHPDQPTTKPTSVRLFNNTSNPIYVGSPSQVCQYRFEFQVFDGQTELQPSRDQCAFTCKELQDFGCTCTGKCVSIVTLVSPGKYYDVGWPGTVFKSTKMPGQCATDASCSGTTQTCLLEEAVPDHALDIRATVYTDKECDSGPCNDCTTGVSGSCIVPGAVRTKGTPLMASASWTGQSPLTLTFNAP